MKYLKRINEDTEVQSIKSIDELKSLPYSQFIKKLVERGKLSELKSQIQSKSSVSPDYGAVKFRTLQADELVPTQSQIGLKESLSWLKNTESVREIIVDKSAKLFENNRILVANNKWIIDGHHRWSYVYMLNPKANIPVININLPGQKPENILKDIQISIAATYNDLYVRQVSIEYNISQMEDQKIYDTVPKFLPGPTIETLKECYGETDLTKYILREFIVPESLYEASLPTQNDFLTNTTETTSVEVDPEMQKIDDEDNDNPDKGNIMNTAADYVGIIDPTGIVDVLNGISYLYQGQYFLAICSIVSAVPLGDLVGKPLMALAKNQIIRKAIQKFAKYLKNFDAKKAAEVWLDLEKLSPKFKDFLEFLVKNIQKVLDFMEVILRKVGDHWLKFKLFYWVFKSKIVNFFKDIFSIKEQLKNYLTKVSENDVFGILSSNIVSIKRLIIDKKVDKMNINFSIGPHPLQTALKAKVNPYGGDFKGVPKDFLTNLPKILSGLKDVGVPKSKEGVVDDYVTFKDKKKKEPIAKIQPEVKEVSKENSKEKTKEVKEPSPKKESPKDKKEKS